MMAFLFKVFLLPSVTVQTGVHLEENLIVYGESRDRLESVFRVISNSERSRLQSGILIMKSSIHSPSMSTL